MTSPAGLVVVDKAGGMTSHDVVARTRRLAGTRKVGHAGTLDPMATGVLVLGLGRATRLLGHLMLTEKAYDATIRLGASTTTDDAEGEAVATASTDHLTPDAVRRQLAQFVGEIDQVPSAVSAIKVDGKRSYARVRAGEDVQLQPRAVTVHELLVHDVVTPGRTHLPAALPSGTRPYAPSPDPGAALGVGGHLTALRRTAVGPFALDAARTLDELTDDFAVLPIAAAAQRAFPSVDLDEQQARDVRVGRALDLDLPGEGEHALFAPDGEFLALYARTGEGRARPVAVFVG